MPIKIKVLYFAKLAQDSQISSETIWTEASTGSQLFEELDLRHGFSLPRSIIRLAVDECFVPWDTVIQDNMSVALIPPVAGG